MDYGKEFRVLWREKTQRRGILQFFNHKKALLAEKSAKNAKNSLLSLVFSHFANSKSQPALITGF